MSDRRTQLLFRPATGSIRPGSGHGYIITGASGWIITGVIRLPGVSGRLTARAGWGPSEDFKTLWVPLTRVDAGGVWNLSGRGIGPSPGIIWITADDRLLLLAGTVDSQRWRQKATEMVFYKAQKTTAPPLSPIAAPQSPAKKPATTEPQAGRVSAPPTEEIDETPSMNAPVGHGKTIDGQKEEERQPTAMAPSADKVEKPDESAEEKPASSVTPPGEEVTAVREEEPDEPTPDAAPAIREQGGEPEPVDEPPGEEKEGTDAKAPISRAPLNRGQPATLAAEPAPQAALPRESESAPLPAAVAPDTIPELMRTCPEDTPFIGLLPGARFARVPIPGGQEYDHYIVGHIPIGEQGFYLVGVPGPAGWQPPAGLSQFMHYLPGRMGGGYWVRYLVPEGGWK